MWFICQIVCKIQYRFPWCYDIYVFLYILSNGSSQEMHVWWLYLQVVSGVAYTITVSYNVGTVSGDISSEFTKGSAPTVRINGVYDGISVTDNIFLSVDTCRGLVSF